MSTILVVIHSHHHDQNHIYRKNKEVVRPTSICGLAQIRRRKDGEIPSNVKVKPVEDCLNSDGLCTRCRNRLDNEDENPGDSEFPSLQETLRQNGYNA